ncbi:MAG: flagellar type III secretion system protein FliQ [Gemmatimonadales bacterium]|nr:flagellar type III secretion system protein FliQ [Gemmatimonadales bacterium]
MTPTLAAELLQRALGLTLTVAGPLLLAALATGVLVSLVQALTQIQEQTLTFIPKLIVMAAVFVLGLTWMMRGLVEFTVQMLRALPGLAG